MKYPINLSLSLFSTSLVLVADLIQESSSFTLFTGTGMINRYVKPPSIEIILSSTTGSDEDITSSKNKTEQIENQMLSLHKEKSGKLQCNTTSASGVNEMNRHLIRQQKLFDDLSTFFNSDDATPEEVKPLLSLIINNVLRQMIDGHKDGINKKKLKSYNEEGDSNDISSDEFRILDIGCGVGALFPFYLKEATKFNYINRLNIVGLDLSSKMINYAKENAKKTTTRRRV